MDTDGHSHSPGCKHDHVHDHGHSHGKGSGGKRLLFMMFFTFSYFVVEIVFGYLTYSMALVADSFHMLSDVVALVVAFVSIILSRRQWSRSTFGLQRAEILGALINAVFLFALCFSIVVESLQRFAEPQSITRPLLVLYVGGFGLLVNLIGLGIFGGHDHSHGKSEPEPSNTNSKIDQSSNITNNMIASENGKAKSTWTVNSDPITLSSRSLPDADSVGTPSEAIAPEDDARLKTNATKPTHSHQMNIHGVFLHILADALGSVVVIISALIVWLTEWEYKDYVDPALSICLVILICISTWPLFVESSMILLQTLPNHINVENFKQAIVHQVGSVIRIRDLHIWQLTGNNVIGSACVICKEGEDTQEVMQKVTEIFRDVGVTSTTIQLEVEPRNIESAETSRCLDSHFQNQEESFCTIDLDARNGTTCSSNCNGHHHPKRGMDNEFFVEDV